MRRCLDEGILQSYLDGELSPETALDATTHLAECEACAGSLAALEGESAFFAAAFASESPAVVPTERLRARVNAAVARFEDESPAVELESQGGGLGAWLSSVWSALSFPPQRAVAFGSLFAVFVFATLFFVVQREGNSPSMPQGEREVAVLTEPEKNQAASSETAPASQTQNDSTSGETSSARAQAAVNADAEFVKASADSRPKRPVLRAKRIEEAEAAGPKAAAFVPGEEEYVETIASLNRQIEAGGDTVLRPSVRVQYERSIAMLDRAIADSRRAALHDPKDKEAAALLMAAYQNKVELLATVADQAQVATLGR